MASCGKILVFGNLFYSGASAIDPLLGAILPRHGIHPRYFPHSSHQMFDEFVPPPYYHWTHLPPEPFLSFFERGALRAVFLHRDPRDVAISYFEDHVHQNKAQREHEYTWLAHHAAREIGPYVRAACRWVEAARRHPIKIVTFDEMKRDTVGLIVAILRFYELPVDDETTRLVSELYKTKYSFEAITKRRRGTSGPVVRTQFMARKGVSGEWRERFDDQIATYFERELGKEIRLLGYT